MNEWICPAPAKLNLFLHILGRRADGYHELQTLFQFLSLGDTLRFRLREDGKVNLNVQLCRKGTEATPPPPDDLTSENNLVLRAARLLQQPGFPGLDITLEKSLPIGGGLGGGSSDAATTLLMLNQIWGCGFSQEALIEKARTLGADVPIFIHGHAALASGIGDQFENVKIAEPWYLVLTPACIALTSQLFSDAALKRNSLPITLDNFLSGERRNDFEPVARRLYPPIAEALDWLSTHSKAYLTGSGACVFAPFETEDAAKNVLQLRPSGLRGFIAQGKNTSPAMAYLPKKP